MRMGREWQVTISQSALWVQGLCSNPCDSVGCRGLGMAAVGDPTRFVSPAPASPTQLGYSVSKDAGANKQIR